MPPNPYRLNYGQAARFFKNVHQTPECWTWTGPTQPNGYGKYRLPGKPERAAHRISWEHHHGTPIPEGHQLDHLCRNRLCVNPAHLEPVTASENITRQDHANRRKTHCPQGHEFTPENTRIDNRGSRRCRECDKGRPR